MKPKYKRLADRMRGLVETGRMIAESWKNVHDEMENPPGVVTVDNSLGFSATDRLDPEIRAHRPLAQWLVNVENALATVCGKGSPHYRSFQDLKPTPGMVRPYQVDKLVGVLSGALEDLEGGYLIGQELLIAGEVYDSVLEYAKELLEAEHKDPAAVLARVALEDALRRIATEENIEHGRNMKASALNDQLKAKQRYPQPQWRQIQVWLDIGNDAAHGRFDNYTEDQVRDMIQGVERFLAAELRP